MLVNSHTRHAFFLFLLSLQLAKKYHPDLNPNAKEESQSKMTELVQAYQRLTSDDYNDAHDSQVALVCEILPLEELGRNPNYDVYAIRVWLWGDDDSSPLTTTKAAAIPSNDDEQRALSIETFMEVQAHPEDSVADLKNTIQDSLADKLVGRRRDRYGFATGWEIVQRQKDKQQSNNNKNNNNKVLSNHFFLSDYRVQHGDLLHAVVRRQSY